MHGWLDTRYSSYNTWAVPLAQGGREDSMGSHHSCPAAGRGGRVSAAGRVGRGVSTLMQPLLFLRQSRPTSLDLGSSCTSSRLDRGESGAGPDSKSELGAGSHSATRGVRSRGAGAHTGLCPPFSEPLKLPGTQSPCQIQVSRPTPQLWG